MNLTADCSGALEGHIPCCAVRADKCLGVIDGKYTILDTSSDEAIGLAVPDAFLEHTTSE